MKDFKEFKAEYRKRQRLKKFRNAAENYANALEEYNKEN